MSPVYWIGLFMPIWIIIIMYANKNNEFKKIAMTKIRRRKEGQTMSNEIISSYIGKECILYTFQTQVTGIIESIQENWITIRVEDKLELINIDYVTRIREYPLKKNGKKKLVV